MMVLANEFGRIYWCCWHCILEGTDDKGTREEGLPRFIILGYEEPTYFLSEVTFIQYSKFYIINGKNSEYKIKRLKYKDIKIK